MVMKKEQFCVELAEVLEERTVNSDGAAVAAPMVLTSVVSTCLWIGIIKGMRKSKWLVSVRLEKVINTFSFTSDSIESSLEGSTGLAQFN